jgi:hypothetical protein
MYGGPRRTIIAWAIDIAVTMRCFFWHAGQLVPTELSVQGYNSGGFRLSVSMQPQARLEMAADRRDRRLQKTARMLGLLTAVRSWSGPATGTGLACREAEASCVWAFRDEG